jgi:hypothetical protein
MPGVNAPVLASAGIIAVSVAVAAAIAIYESPELRRYADDIRRRIAIAMHSLGDGITPNREPVFNRPEDAHGFLETRRGDGAEPGVDADEETRRRQREELIYWNALHLEKKERERKEAEAAEAAARVQPTSPQGSSFDDFLRQDDSAERGAFVFNTGADVHGDNEGLVRRRGADGVRGLNSSLYANPFSDEHHIDSDEMGASLAPENDEIMSDIYSATTRDAVGDEVHPAMIPIDEVLSRVSHIESTPTLDRELGPDEFITAGQEDRQDAYASIQAWAQGSNPTFYSPLPMSPAAPMSEPELISDGALTPTDSASLAGSGEDIAEDTLSSRNSETGRFYDVMSESDGMATPANWSEVGSVVSENEGPMHA